MMKCQLVLVTDRAIIRTSAKTDDTLSTNAVDDNTKCLLLYLLKDLFSRYEMEGEHTHPPPAHKNGRKTACREEEYPSSRDTRKARGKTHTIYYTGYGRATTMNAKRLTHIKH